MNASNHFLNLQMIKGTAMIIIVPPIMKSTYCHLSMPANDIWLGGNIDKVNKKAIAKNPHPPTSHIPAFPPGMRNALFTSG